MACSAGSGLIKAQQVHICLTGDIAALKAFKACTVVALANAGAAELVQLVCW